MRNKIGRKEGASYGPLSFHEGVDKRVYMVWDKAYKNPVYMSLEDMYALRAVIQGEIECKLLERIHESMS